MDTREKTRNSIHATCMHRGSCASYCSCYYCVLSVPTLPLSERLVKVQYIRTTPAREWRVYSSNPLLERLSKAKAHYMHTYMHRIAAINTGWRRFIGWLKLQVIFRQRATNFGALLLKRTYKDQASYGSSPPSTTFTPDRKASKRAVHECKHALHCSCCYYHYKLFPG